MRLLDRYLFRELLAPLAICLGGFLIFWISFSLFNELDKLQEAKLHLLDVIEYSIAMTPEFLVTAIPIALLLALLYALTSHARHNEITAMRAAGVSLWRVCIPYFIVGFFASVVLFALNEIAVPRGEDWADKILNRYVQKPNVATTGKSLAFYNDRAQRAWNFSKFNFRKAELDDVVVIDQRQGIRLDASRAVYTNGVWKFFNVMKSVKSPVNQSFVPAMQTNASVLAMPEFSETPREIKVDLQIAEYEKLNTRKKMVPLADIFDYLRLRPGVKSGWLQTQLHEHFAAPLTCIVVVLIAIPFGAASGRRNLFFGVAGSIFICFAYFIIQQISFAIGFRGIFPGWLAAWLPNFIFGAAGVFLTMRVR
jgi:lipopolysaccharide export system permease protein